MGLVATSAGTGASNLNAGYSPNRMKRRFNAWIGRKLLGNNLLKDAIWSADALTGSLYTIQDTTSEQGGVVKEPA